MVCIQKGTSLCSVSAEPKGTEKLVNGKQHFVWYIPSEMNGLPQNVHFNFWLEFLKGDLTINLPSIQNFQNFC